MFCVNKLHDNEDHFNFEQKLQLKSDFEKEAAEILAKYETKQKTMEAELLAQRRELHENQKIVEINMHLADAFISKCFDNPKIPSILYQGTQCLSVGNSETIKT